MLLEERTCDENMILHAFKDLNPAGVSITLSNINSEI